MSMYPPAAHGALAPAARRTSPRKRRLAVGALAAGAAGAVALALVNRATARRSEARHPPRGRFIDVAGVRLHYLEAGEGPPIVLLHGNGVSSDDFLVSGLFGRLALDRRVIAFDRPGFGYSERPPGRPWTAARQAELIAGALQHLGVESPVVVGHSWGALVAAELALRDPGALSGLVLVSGYYRPGLRLDFGMAAIPAVPGVGDVLRHTLAPPLNSLLAPLIVRRLFKPGDGASRFLELYPISQSLRPGQLRAAAAESGLIGPDAARLAARLGELKTPTLVIAGGGDRLVGPERHSAWLVRQLPDAGLLTLNGSGHMVHHSDMESVAMAVLAFAPAPVSASAVRAETASSDPRSSETRA